MQRFVSLFILDPKYVRQDTPEGRNRKRIAAGAGCGRVGQAW
jgi:hypothetical protein